jgi:hypothetical protein
VTIVEHLIGMKTTLPLPSGLDEDILKWFMYHRLADYLAAVLRTLRPPPPPDLPGLGILSGVFAKHKQRSDSGDRDDHA